MRYKISQVQHPYNSIQTPIVHREAGIAALVVQLEVPFLVLLGVFLLREKLELRKWFGILIAFCGVAIMTQQDEFSGSVTSMLLVVGGAFSWALGQVMIRKLKDIDGLQVTTWIAVFAFPQLLVMSLLFEEGQIEAIQDAAPIVWWAVVYLGVVMTALGYYFWNTLIRRHDVGKIAPFLLLLPVFSVIGGVVFLNEVPTLTKLAGGAIILFGVAIILFTPARNKTKTT